MSGFIDPYGFAASVIRGVQSEADWVSILNWMMSENRKPAHLAFSAGPERQVAYSIEHAMANRLDSPAASGTIEPSHSP